MSVSFPPNIRESLKPHCFSVEEYYRMGETGILPETLRTELIRGEILEMPPIGATHTNSFGLVQ